MAYTLPEDLCTVVPVTTEYILRERGVTYQASGEPVTEDFHRFSAYASRVKVLSAEEDNDQLFDNHEIPFDVWTALLLVLPYPIASVFSALRWFAIGCTWPVVADDAMLDAVTWAWPNLESLASTGHPARTAQTAGPKTWTSPEQHSTACSCSHATARASPPSSSP
ncbi:hypothetical protein TRAPUB_7064 [Trametes pubescens]|uniref:Uncharacterized protein n=1 Tax=Trametes pubescens TaxID=154538 RepID=A0A1M2V471_TRAPU|nr:hypothetical protein TRAPUB_7064 [Trametes pubescens]